MSPVVRHLACALCRNRKVKCDGGRPSCRRCVKAGEDCVYSNSTNASRAELQGTIRRLLERIEQTEAYQVAMMTQQNPSLFNRATPGLPFSTDMNQLEPAMMLDQTVQTAAGGSGIQSPFISHGNTSSSIPGVPSPASVGGESVFSSDSRHLFSYSGTPDTGNTSVADTVTAAASTTKQPAFTPGGSQLPPPTILPCTDRGPPSVQDTHVVMAQPASAPSDESRLPSLHDVQQWARHGPSGSSRQGKEGTADIGSASNGDVEGLLDEFAALSTTTVRAQREIMGVAETAAMYLQYFRREGGGVVSQNHDRENSVRLLETLEQRMREISHVASSQVLAQARNSRTNLKAHGAYKDRMMELEAELGPLDEELEAFFRTGYDLGKPLAGQME